MVLELLNMAFRGSDDTQQFLDVGCAGGDFTHDVLLQKCGPCKRLVGVDLSVDMIEHARKNYAHPKLTFDVLDIRKDVSLFLKSHGPFQRVYSFYCLHWVRDQETAVSNIAQLLTSDGECLLVFCGRTILYEIWSDFAKVERWKRYVASLEQFIPPSQHVSDLRSYLKNLLEVARLEPHTCEVLHHTWVFPSEESVKDTVLPLLPIAADISKSEKEAMFEDLCSRVLARCTKRPDGVSMEFSLYAVHASKLP